MPPIITGLDRSRNLRLWSLALLAGLVFFGCDKVPLLAPPESTITVLASNSVVQANGTAEIRAVVLESSGTPVQNGTTVLFTATLGSLSPTEARTTNGVAMVQFVANGQSGVAQVRAFSGGATTENPLELMVGAAAAGRLVVTASPSQVSSGGTSTITARITDLGGTPLSGVVVSFTTTTGSLSSASASTSASGEAQVTLTATRDATVTATAGGVSSPITVTVSTLPDLTISTVSGLPTPVEGQPVAFTITVGTPAGTTSTESLQSIVVDFGDGTNSRTLDGNSGVHAVAHIYNTAGTYTVVATGTSANGSTRQATTVIVVVESEFVDVIVTKNPATPVSKNELVTFSVVPVPGASSYRWTFGDGSPSFTGGSQVTHAYTKSGIWTVLVTVSKTDGSSGRGQTQVVVN